MAKGNSPNIGPPLTVGTPFGARMVSSALSVVGTSVVSRPWARLTRASPSRQWRRSLCDGRDAHCPRSVWVGIGQVRTAEGGFQECGKLFYMPKRCLPHSFDDPGFA